MNLVRQPPNSNLCGQACVATVCGKSLDESVAAFGTRGKTSARHVRAALAKFGATGGPTIRNHRMVAGLPEATAIVKFTKGKWAHWVLWHKRKFYDPAAGVFRELPRYLADAKPTSYLEISVEQSQ